MSAQDTWIGHDLRADVGNELGVGSLPEKRVDRVANELDAAPTDIPVSYTHLDVYKRQGQVSELYHPGYMAKRMEVGAVVGATPASHVRRECPAPRGSFPEHPMVHDVPPPRA